ncbi:MAG: restriction endonuclease subunit S [Chloroflexi bacterium]|nr:MAG: restriction endonuclease subunit S [Chloroflexota bacterium]
MNKHNKQAGWTLVKFGEVARQIKDKVNPETSDLDRYVAGGHMNTDDLKIRRWGIVGDGYLGPAFHRKFQKGQILYGSRRTYLRKVAVAEFDGICANTTFVIEAIPEKIYPPLLPFIMQSEPFVEHSIKNSRGSTNPYVNWKDIAKYEFALPPPDEQRRIAEVLTAVEETIRQFQNSEEQAFNLQRAFREQLIHKTSNTAKTVKLINLLTGNPESGHSAHSVDKVTGHFVLSLSALSKTGYEFGHLKTVELTSQMRAALLYKNDFLISRSNTRELVGLVGIFNEDRLDVSFPDTMMRLPVDESKINKKYLEQYLLSREGRFQLQRISAGTSASMKKINRKSLSQVPVLLPTLEMQEEILEQLQICEEAFQAVQQKVLKSINLKNALLSQFLSG